MEDRDYPKSYIKTEYHGFDGFVQGYLTFDSNRKVRVRRIGGYFDKIGNDTNLYIYEHCDTCFAFWDDINNNNYIYTVEVSSSIKIEKKRNSEYKSKVKADYSRYE